MNFRKIALSMQAVMQTVISANDALWFSVESAWHDRVDVPFRRAYAESFALRVASQLALCAGIIIGVLITRIGVVIGAGAVAGLALAFFGELENPNPWAIVTLLATGMTVAGAGFALALGSLRLLGVTPRKILGSTFAVLFGCVFLWLGLGLTGLLVKFGLDIGGFFEYAMLDWTGMFVGTLMIVLGFMSFGIAVGIAKATPEQVRAYG